MSIKPTRCEIRDCSTTPFVNYMVSWKVLKVLCRKHMLEYERRGRRPRDLEAMSK